MTSRIRFGTDLITFFNPTFWGLSAELTHPQWVHEFSTRPRHYFDRMLDASRAAGMEGIELAPDPGGWESAMLAYGSVGAFKNALAERDLTLASSFAHGRQLIGNAMDDPSAESIADDALNRHAAFLAELGTSVITIGNIARGRFGDDSPDDTATEFDFAQPVPLDLHERFADQLNRLGEIVSKHGVVLAIHTDAYSVCSRNEDIETVMSLTDPGSIGLCPDAGHITLDGGDAVEVLASHIDRVPTMHWKDCSSPLSAHLLRGNQRERHEVMLTHFRILGSGSVDWIEWMRVLEANEWSGWAIEEIDHSPDPIGELRQGLEFYRAELETLHA